MSKQYKEFRDVPTDVLAARLKQLGRQVAKGDYSDLSMRIPAELDRDADLVLTGAGMRLIELQERGEKAESERDGLAAKLKEIEVENFSVMGLLL